MARATLAAEVARAMLRGAAFNAGYAVITMVWATVSVLVGWAMPFPTRFAFVVGIWARAVLWWLRFTCGIRHYVTGAETLPTEPCVVLAKHQSTWETVYLQTQFAPQATVLKRELLRIPFFGWVFALLRPIAIDRSQKIGAMRQLIRDGAKRLNEGLWVVLLPEGKRVDPGENLPFFRGGAALAHAAKRPIVVVAHNAGRHWPAHRLAKFPGTIQVRISPPISTQGRSVTEVNRLAEAWLAEAMEAIATDSAQMSRLDTYNALLSMKARRGST